MDEDTKALMKKIDAFLENRGIEAQSRPGILDRMKMFYYASEVQGVDIARYLDSLDEEEMPEEDEWSEFEEGSSEEDYEDEEGEEDVDDYEDPRIDNRRREQRRAPIDDSMGDDDIDIEPVEEEEKVEVKSRGRPQGFKSMPPPNPPKRAPLPPEPIRGPPKPALKKPEFTPPSQEQIDEGAF